MLWMQPLAPVVHERRSRYSVRPPKEFTSNFERRLMMKEKAKTEKEEQKRLAEAKLLTVRCYYYIYTSRQLQTDAANVC